MTMNNASEVESPPSNAVSEDLTATKLSSSIGQALSTSAQDQDEQSAKTSADFGLSLDASDPCNKPEAQDTAGSLELPPYHPASDYWDATTMAPLSAASAAAIARLRAYKPPPFPTWDRLPASRRGAVLILLFADRRGDLRVVVTMRAASLRSFAGHAAFPGGKADSAAETPYQIARREAWEEIGLPMDDSKLPKPFRIEPLCNLPCSLAKTELVVRPCVAYLHADRAGATASNSNGSSIKSSINGRVTADESMMPRLDAKEVAAVFTASLYNFLKENDEPRRPGEPALPPGHWYDGYWSHWHDKAWRVHRFHVPVDNQRVSKPDPTTSDSEKKDNEDEPAVAPLVAKVEEEEEQVRRFLVWGLTGRMLVDAARVAYGEEPEFEHNDHYGDEEIIAPLEAAGRLPDKKSSRSSNHNNNSNDNVSKRKREGAGAEGSGSEPGGTGESPRVVKDAKI